MNQIMETEIRCLIECEFILIPVASARHGGKRPLQPEWAKKGAATGQTIESWETEFPGCNIGCVTGATSGIFVVDVDAKSGGLETLEGVQVGYGRLPETLTSETGGGGLHLIFRHPGVRIPNKVSLFPGIDIRGDGGMIVVPPSTHANGNQYRWRTPVSRDNIANAPDWLISAILAHDCDSEINSKQSRRMDAYLSMIPEGTRNTTLTSLTGHLLSRGLDPYLVLDLVQGQNLHRCSPPLPKAEVLRIVNSICKRESIRLREVNHVGEY